MTSIIAIIAAIGSYWLAFKSQGILALLVALLAVGAGLIGGLKALSPRVSGGLLSLTAVGLGLLAILFAVIAIIL